MSITINDLQKIKNHPKYFSLQFINDYLNTKTNYHLNDIDNFLSLINYQLDLNDGFSCWCLLQQEPQNLKIKTKLKYIKMLNHKYGNDKLYNYNKVLNQNNYQPLTWQQGLADLNQINQPLE